MQGGRAAGSGAPGCAGVGSSWDRSPEPMGRVCPRVPGGVGSAASGMLLGWESAVCLALSAGSGAVTTRDLSLSAARGLATLQVSCGWVWPHLAGPLSLRSALPRPAVNRGVTPALLLASVLSGLASVLAGAQGAMVNRVSPKHLGFLFPALCQRRVCGAELAGGAHAAGEQEPRGAQNTDAPASPGPAAPSV